MPNRKQKDCSKGKIYFVRSNDPEIKSKYVGSTIQTLAQRMTGHRAQYKAWLKGSGNPCTIYYEFQKYGIEQFHIELIEDYPCEREEQLLARENFFIRQEECVNKCLAIRTYEEKLSYNHKYYQEHKEEIRIQKEQYNQEHKEEKKVYNDKYRQEHKEELNNRCKEYYQNTKEKITCVCGCEILKQCLAKHLKSNKHKSLIAFSI